MSTQPQPRLSPEQYLELERRAETKSEFFEGEMFAMSGASLHHNLITSNCMIAFGNALRDHECNVFGSDMRVATSPDGLYTYPDLSITCGERKFVDGQLDTLLNPVLIIEVLSPSTRRYDRTSKLALYRGIPSLRDYLLISQNSVHIEHYSRQSASDWLLHESRDLADTLHLPSLGIVIPFSEIYRRLDFPTAP